MKKNYCAAASTSLVFHNNVEELTFIVAKGLMVRIHLLVHHVLLGEKKNNEIAKFPTSVRQ